jgi:cysteine desulfurase/selenocysteine lyase
VTAAVAQSPSPAPPFDVERLRADFPALHQEVHGKRLVYLDSAASSLTPQPVIDAIVHHYTHDRANIHRGVHLLSQRATLAFEGAREKLRAFIGAASTKEIVFVRGTTEALNLAAYTLAKRLGPGDEVLITALEHHSNIVPWQMVCEQSGAVLKHVPIDEKGELVFEAYEALLSERTKVVALSHVSNALGTINPVARMAALAKEKGAVVVVDGAQAIPHQPVDVSALGCDLYAFSGHKMFGPTGVGVLWGREDVLESLGPWQGGGDMIMTVTLEKSTWAALPSRLEAGTPDISGVIGLGAAVDYLESVGMEHISAWEGELLAYATACVAELEGVRLVGTAAEKAGVLSFVVDDVHPHDIGTILDREGVAIRTGHHCAQPVMDHFGVPATARASFAAYNTRDEVDTFVRALSKCIEVFR